MTVPHEAPKRGRSTSKTAEIQVIPVPKSSRAASSRKKAKNPTDGAGPELAKALTEHYVIGGRSESRTRAESTPAGQQTRTPSRPRRTSSVAAETPFVAPHVAPLAPAAAELEEDVVPHFVATPKRVSFKNKHKPTDLGLAPGHTKRPRKLIKTSFAKEKRPRGRPLGSKNKSTKAVSLEGMTDPVQ